MPRQPVGEAMLQSLAARLTPDDCEDVAMAPTALVTTGEIPRGRTAVLPAQGTDGGAPPHVVGG